VFVNQSLWMRSQKRCHCWINHFNYFIHMN
jgi:hypothetical protein